jgi:hypothetical protein
LFSPSTPKSREMVSGLWANPSFFTSLIFLTVSQISALLWLRLLETKVKKTSICGIPETMSSK